MHANDLGFRHVMNSESIETLGLNTFTIELGKHVIVKKRLKFLILVQT